MSGIELYRDSGLEIYEKAHYSHGEHLREVEAILSWYRGGRRILDIGCGGGLHALELARRGYQVTGLDIESSAISLARERNLESGLDAIFLVVDLENADLADLGKFDLVCSLGNVISHIAKKSMPDVTGKVSQCLATGGIFLFDVLAVGNRFPAEVREKGTGIIWKRCLDRKTGEISLEGTFESFGFSQDFRVWGYTREEMVKILTGSGFTHIDASDSLDFSNAGTVPETAVCLRFKAWMGEEK